MKLLLIHAPTATRSVLTHALGKLWREALVIERETVSPMPGSDDIGMVVVDSTQAGNLAAADIRRACRAHAAAPVVMLSALVDLALVVAAFDRGMAGVVPKTIPVAAMVQALRLIASGERFVPASVLANARPLDADKPNYAESGGPALDRLTPREREVLGLLLDGGSNKAIGRSLHLTEATVKAYMMTLCRKLGARNRAQAVRIAVQNGFGAPVAAAAAA